MLKTKYCKIAVWFAEIVTKVLEPVL